jgi:hypothetical protein
LGPAEPLLVVELAEHLPKGPPTAWLVDVEQNLGPALSHAVRKPAVFDRARFAAARAAVGVAQDAGRLPGHAHQIVAFEIHFASGFESPARAGFPQFCFRVEHGDT